VFNAALGGDATFKQVYAVVAHSGILIAVQQLFTLPLDYARETMSSPTNLAVFLPFLDEGSFFARLLGSIDLFRIWWIVNLAIGMAVLYKRRTAPIATTMLVLYAAIALCSETRDCSSAVCAPATPATSRRTCASATTGSICSRN
jgi:hypothetical protein